ncbi:MAG: hypothetical protein AB2L12_18180 [Smithellaceae bacterium]
MENFEVMQRSQLLSTTQQPNNYKLSILLSSCSVILLFSDPRVLLRTFFGQYAEALGLIILGILFLATVRAFRINNFSVKTYYVAFFIIISIIRAIYSDVPILTIVQMIPTLIGIIALSIIGYQSNFIKHLFIAFSFAMSLHFVSIYIPLDFLKPGYNFSSFYGIFYYEITREFGYTTAPGVLSLYSAMGMSIATVMLSREKKIIWLILLLVSIGCGISTYNRSFISGIVVYIFLLPVIFVKSKKKIVYLFLIIVFILSSFYSLSKTDYADIMKDRFTSTSFERDLETRFKGGHGIIPSLKSVLNNPIMGNQTYNVFLSRIETYNGEEYISPSNGFASILATRGLIFFIPFLIWTITAIVNLYNLSFKSNNDDDKNTSFALLACFLVGQAVCISDALLESFAMLMPLTLGLLIRVEKNNKY